MKLSSRVRYGCRALVDLAVHHDEGPVALDVLARDTSIPEKYLAKIIQDLRRSGLIRSVRGSHGGYLLNGLPADVTVLDVWEALEGPLCPVDCLENPEGCHLLDECVTRDVWSQVRDAVSGVLRSVTLEALAEKYEAKVGRHAAVE
jgi:Rrf2 family cysteine metabolism transcriptional repressor